MIICKVIEGYVQVELRVSPAYNRCVVKIVRQCVYFANIYFSVRRGFDGSLDVVMTVAENELYRAMERAIYFR